MSPVDTYHGMWNQWVAIMADRYAKALVYAEVSGWRAAFRGGGCE